MSSPNLCYWTIAQTGMVVPKAEGMPGTTKTKSVEAFARAMGRRCYTLIGSLREPADIGGYPYPVEVEPVTDPVSGKTVHTYMALMPPKWAMDTWHNGDKWLVFIDELTTCFPPGTPVELACGGLAAIEQLRPGDLVRGVSGANVVQSITKRIATSAMELETDDGHRITATPEHPFYTQRGWIALCTGLKAGWKIPKLFAGEAYDLMKRAGILGGKG